MTKETKSLSRDDFNKALKQFVVATTASSNYARICAEAGIIHFAEHGDLVYCQEFYDSMPKNYLRRAAFVKWLAAFSPVRMTEEKLHKDKSETAKEFNLDAALGKPFWEFAPDKEQVYFGATDVVVDLTKVIKKYKTNERYHALNEAAMAKVVEAEKAIAAIA